MVIISKMERFHQVIVFLGKNNNMEFGLTITATGDMNKSDVIYSMSEKMEKYFEDKDYGKGVKAITIGIYCQNLPPGFEKFAKPPKPKYIKGKRTMNYDGISFVLENNLEYGISIDFNSFNNASKEEAKIILAKKISASLSGLNPYASRIKDFDVLQFIKDCERFLLTQEYIPE